MKTFGIGISIVLYSIFSFDYLHSQCIICDFNNCGQLNIGFSPGGGVEFCEGSEITFVNTSAPGFDFFILNWSDGTIDTLNSYANALHTYNVPDSILCLGNQIITVCFRGIKNCPNGESCAFGTYDFNLKVRPKAIFNVQSQYCIQSAVNFNNSSCNAGMYLWNFGDGNTSTQSNPSHSYSFPGTYNVSLIAMNDCGSDTIINSIFIAEPQEPLISQIGNELVALADQGTIQWVDCNNNFQFIPGETNQSFSPLTSGNYAYIYNENACVDTSDCIQVITGLADITNKIQIKYYPNPTNHEIFLESVSDVKFEYEILSNTGQVVTSSILAITAAIINMNRLDTGLYFLKIRQSGGVKVFKIIKS